MIITACEFNQVLNVRLHDGVHHMTLPDSLLDMENQKSDTLFSTLMFYVVKRSNISAHNAFVRVQSRAGCHREREREGEFTLLTFPALSPSVCDALLLLLKRGLHQGARWEQRNLMTGSILRGGQSWHYTSYYAIAPTAAVVEQNT